MTLCGPLTASQDGTITIATVTVKGEQAGTTGVSLSIGDIGDDDANSYTENPVNGATLTVAKPDTTAPTISNFNVSADGQNVDVSFDSDEQLDNISVSLGGDASGTLTEGDFSESESGGTYTYTADVSEGQDGTFSATLDTATDAAGNDGATGQSDSVTVDTVPDNQPPNADAGEDKTVAEGNDITLNASGSSDPDSDTLSYSWNQTGGPSVDLSDSDTAMPTFTAPNVDSETTLTFEVTVTDGNGGTDTDSVTVTVTPVDDAAPTISSFDLTNPNGQTLKVQFDSDEALAEISVDVTNGNGETVTTLNAGDFSSADGSYTATYEAGSPATYTATLVTAADAAGNDGATGQSDSVTIEAPNGGPTAAFTYSPENPIVGDEVSFDASGSNDDGTIASYEWTFGDGATATGQQVTHTYDSAGDYTVTLTVTDDEGATDTTTQTVTVADEGAPALAVSPESLDFGSVTVGQTETETVTVTNDGDAPMSVTQTSISGPNGGEFTVLDNPAGNDADDESFTLPPGESRTVSVEFAPGSNGDKAATFIANTENAGRETVSLSGTAEEAETGPEKHTLTIVGSGDRADYTFSVTSDDLEKSTANGANINGNDEVRRGYVGAGSVGISADSYTYTGELETFGLDGDATVLVDGETIGDEVDDMRNNVIEIAGTGSAADYDFAATDSGTARLEKVTSNNANRNSNDEVFRTTGNGQVGISADAYGFNGVIDSLDVDGDAAVYVNGRQVDPDNEQDNMITVVGTGDAANYAFTTSGGIAPSTANYANTNGNDEINGMTKTGQVGISADSNDYNGDITSFDVAGADVEVYVDGQQIDQDDVADEA